MIDFLTIVLAIFGVLQIILFFKMWGMTNNVNKIKDKIGSETKEEDYIIDAQINAMNGDKEEAFELYKKAFYLNVPVKDFFTTKFGATIINYYNCSLFQFVTCD